MSDNPADYELVHYGVKGMKWGVRKEERRAIKAANLRGTAGKLSANLKQLEKVKASIPKGAKHALARNANAREIKSVREIRDRAVKDAEAVEKGKLTRNQKQLLIGAAIVGGLAVGSYLAVKNDSGELRSIMTRGQSLLLRNGELFNKNESFAKKNLSPDEVLSSVVRGINPNYRSQGGMMNCRRASMAYEMRRRGLDVVATVSSIGTGHTESGLINALTPGGKNVNSSENLSSRASLFGGDITRKVAGDRRKNPATQKNLDNTNYKTLLSAFSDQPSGARGEMAFNFGTFIHSMSWEIFDGKPVIFDAQKANKYDVSEEGLAKMSGKWGESFSASMTRLDDRPLDEIFLSRWVQNTPKGKK